MIRHALNQLFFQFLNSMFCNWIFVDVRGASIIKGNAILLQCGIFAKCYKARCRVYTDDSTWTIQGTEVQAACNKCFTEIVMLFVGEEAGDSE